MSAVTNVCQTDGQTLLTVAASVGGGCWRGKRTNAEKCPGFTDRGLRLIRPAASPIGGRPKRKSLSRTVMPAPFRFSTGSNVPSRKKWQVKGTQDGQLALSPHAIEGKGKTAIVAPCR